VIVAPFLLRIGLAYRFLPPFFFPPAIFFAIGVCPSLHRGLCAGSHLRRSVAAFWHARPARSAVAWLQTLHASATSKQKGRAPGGPHPFHLVVSRALSDTGKVSSNRSRYCRRDRSSRKM
jgi:hypothetical protein